MSYGTDTWQGFTPTGSAWSSRDVVSQLVLVGIIALSAGAFACKLRFSLPLTMLAPAKVAPAQESGPNPFGSLRGTNFSTETSRPPAAVTPATAPESMASLSPGGSPTWQAVPALPPQNVKAAAPALPGRPETILTKAEIAKIEASVPLPQPRPPELARVPAPETTVPAAPRPVPERLPVRQGSEESKAASVSSVPVDNRTFLERLFGVARPAIANLGYDRYTAVYDISAHTVYLPDGTKLEAHSGLGSRLDDPQSVAERDRGATPPHLYELEARTELFHGVQALRLNPVGGGGIFGRDGLLAHTYMLGPRGDSNGCVSFRNYDAFLQAFQRGLIKRLAVVARMS